MSALIGSKPWNVCFVPKADIWSVITPISGVVVAVAKKAFPAFKTGKEMRARLNRDVPSA
jgi:hypothetical protein